MTMKTKTVESPTGPVELSVPEDTRELAVKAMENADEEIIRRAIATGLDSGPSVYQFESEGKMVRGISLAGVRRLTDETFKAPLRWTQVTHEMLDNSDHIAPATKAPSKIHLMVVQCESPDGKLRGIGAVGEPEYKKRRDGSYFYNPFSIQMALGKAKRNASKDLLLLKQVESFIQKVIAKGRDVKQLTAESARDPKADRDARTAAILRGIFSTVKSALPGVENAEDLYRAFVRRAFGKGLSEMTTEEIVKVSQDLHEALKKTNGKENLKKAVGA